MRARGGGRRGEQPLGNWVRVEWSGESDEEAAGS